MRRLLAPLPIAAIAISLAVVGLLAYGLGSNEPDRGIEAALARGERPAAPPLGLPQLDGRGSRSLKGYRGRVVVVNFWASWCEPCRTESPLLERWHRRMEKAGGLVLGVDVLDVASDARRFARKLGLTYPLVRDGDGDVLGRFGVVAYPETFVIDRRGRIAASQRGPVDDAWMRKHVQPLLEERG